ncbi:MAG TPA: RteC domain-containing protein [Chitinophagaceae bacterium]|jgi:hypothetical protein
MRKMCNEARQLYAVLKDEIAQMYGKVQDPLSRADAGLRLCQESLQLLKDCFDRCCLDDEAEEIHFFKHEKPLFIAELLYHLKLFGLYCQWPRAGTESEEQWLLEKLGELKREYGKYPEFYLYYRMGGTDRDHFYFKHGNRLVPTPEYCAAVTDKFTTGYDMVMGNLMALERLEAWLAEQLNLLREKPGGRESSAQKLPLLPWTGDKTCVVELVYGLKESGCIKNGDVTLTEIANGLGLLFGIDLTEHPRAWYSIKQRQKDSGFFIKTLWNALLRAMGRKEEPPGD